MNKLYQLFAKGGVCGVGGADNSSQAHKLTTQHNKCKKSRASPAV